MKPIRQLLIIAAALAAAGSLLFGGSMLARSLQTHYAELDEAAAVQTETSEPAVSPSAEDGTDTSADDETAVFSVVYDGQTYTYNSALRNVLLIGADCMEPVADMTAESEDLCDFLLLISIDESTGKCTLLQLNRDTMCDVVVYNEDGTTGTVYEQLAYAHSSYTASEDEKCLAAAETVSNLLYDIPIDNYIALNMGGLPALVDLVGGVTVPILYDFSGSQSVLAQYEEGDTALLDGETALVYVREREGIQDTTNADRMVRQQVFMHALAEELRERYNDDPQFAVDAFMTAADYLVTDCSAEELADLVGLLAAADTSEILIPEGQNAAGENYTEFYPDEDALRELAVNTFFLPDDTQ